MEFTKEQIIALNSFLVEIFAFTLEQTAAVDQQLPMTQVISESIPDRCAELGSAADQIFYRLLRVYPDMTSIYADRIEKK